MDPMVACWMLSPDSELSEFEFESVLTQYRVPVPAGKKLVSHGTGAVGSADGTGPAVSVDVVRDHLVFLEALVDAVWKRLVALQLDKPFQAQVCAVLA
jgi:hypothetical protein